MTSNWPDVSNIKCGHNKLGEFSSSYLNIPNKIIQNVQGTAMIIIVTLNESDNR